MKLLKLIFEAKAVGLLYHYTTPGAWWEMKDCDCLRAGGNPPFEKTPPFISTTRNKNFHNLPSFDTGLGLSSSGPPTIRLTLDGTKLSQKYKIRPHSYFTGPPSDDPYTPNDKYYLDEYEERIYASKIPNLSFYLTDAIDTETGKSVY